MRFSEDGRRLVTAGDDGVVRVVGRRRRCRARRAERPQGRGHGRGVRPGTDTVVSGGEDGTLRSGRPAADAVMVAPVTGASFAPDGRRVVSGGVDGAVRIWDIATGRSRRARPRGDELAQFSADGERIISAS